MCAALCRANSSDHTLASDQIIKFGPDSTLVLPAGIDHQIVNSGDVPLVTIAALAATPVVTVGSDGVELELPWNS